VITTSRLRLFRFSLVGAIGIAVQLGVLAVLIAMKMNYLLATALAVEAAVLHNFLWHQRFTWADRTGRGVRAALAQLLRFHLSNGLISLLGNLLLMRLLAGWLRVPVLAANLATISLCFVANYLASDRWVFLSGDSYQGTSSVGPQRSQLSIAPLGADSGSGWRLRPITHQQQSTLGEGQIDQSRSDGEGQAHPDLRRQQEWRKGPELIKHKNSGEQAKEFSAETGNVERDRRQQIKTNRNAHRSRQNQDSCDPGRPREPMLQQFYDYAQPGQCCDVEAEIHDLNEQKEYTHVSVRNRWQIVGSSEQGSRRQSTGHRTGSFGR
jgi:putative flippase GtrA